MNIASEFSLTIEKLVENYRCVRIKDQKRIHLLHCLIKAYIIAPDNSDIEEETTASLELRSSMPGLWEYACVTECLLMSDIQFEAYLVNNPICTYFDPRLVKFEQWAVDKFIDSTHFTT